ncbi:Rhodanese-like domain-containing protein [Dichotomocladium elegans]|nr:Rhodanese-like domain-containing protein [Dichotomocladium elegans]
MSSQAVAKRHFGRVISTHDLADSLDKVKVLDGSWHMPNANRDPYKEYLAKHIPGARFFGIDDIKDTTVDLPHMLPTAQDFASAMERLGISDQDQVVVYDSVGLLSAARVYWTFKAFGHENVSVLNGGLPKWLAEGRPVAVSGEGEEEDMTADAHYKVPTLQKALVRDYDAMLANARAGGKPAVVLDARSTARFMGAAAEPRPGLSSGHMPGSINVPFELVINDGQLLDQHSLKTLFQSKGVDMSSEIVTSCGSGITASILYLALEESGAKNIAVYDGSWTEYAGRKESIIVKDP